MEQKIMNRVKRIYYLRKVINPVALKVYGLAACTATLFSVVSIMNIYANMPSPLAPGAFMSFVMNALSHTEGLVQVLIVGIVATALMLGRDLMRGNVGRGVKSFAHA